MKEMNMISELDKEWSRWAKEVEIIKFYALAKQYGFCFPGCFCKEHGCRQETNPIE
jgi:hypothetical protein